MATGDVVAAEEVSADMNGLFELQAGLTRAVAGMLNIALSRQARSYDSSHSESYRCYARARLAVQRITKQSLEEARELLDEALRVQPDYADALGLLAGLARATGQEAALREAVRLFENRAGYSFEVFHGAMAHQTLSQLAAAAESLGLSQEPKRLDDAALAEGALGPFTDDAP